MQDLALVAAIMFLLVIAIGPVAIGLVLLRARAAIVLTAAFLAMAIGIWWAAIPPGARFAGVVSVFYGALAIILLHVRRITE